MSSSRFFAKFTALAAASFALAAPLAAVSTDTAVQVSYDHFEDGKMENISIPSDGGLRLAPALEQIAKLDAAVIWKAVADKDGNLYVGTGNDGKVFKVTPDGKATVLFEPGESLARSLALDDKGNLYVGTSPDGYVYRITPGGRPEIYFHPGDTYIWDLQFDIKGNLYVATGAKGHIYRLPPDYKADQTAEVYFTTDRTHVTTLAFDSQGALLAGAGPKSLVYRITDKDKATVLASPGGEEISGLSAQPDGSVYFSTFNKPSGASSSSGRSGSSSASAAGSTPPAAAAGGGGGAPPPTAGDDGADGATDAAGGPSGGSPPSPSTASGPKYSQLYRINPSGFVEPVWSLARTGVYSFRPLPNGRWLVGSDQHGRIFDATSPSDWNLLQETPEGSEVSVLLADPKDAAATFVFSSNPAQIYHLGSKPAASGTYTCEPFDGDQTARWGTLRTLAVPPMPNFPLAGAKWETRTGNTPKPDSTWSDWQPIADTTDIASPAARYFQYRVTLTDAAVTVRRLSVYFEHFNAAPVIDRLGVLPVGVDISTSSPPRAPVDLRTILEGDSSALSSSPPSRPQVRATGESGAFSVAWHATDANTDPLSYTVNLRAVGDAKWVTLADDLMQPVFSFSSHGYADGYYQVQVIASDKLANPPGQARTGERTSTPFLINNTGPTVTLDSQTGDATRYIITFHAHSATTVLDHAQYTLDGQPSKPALPDGNLFDKPDHVFHVQLDHLKSGSHSVVFEVVDEADNPGSAKVTFDVP